MHQSARSGPFVVPARLVLLLSGALAIGFGLFNLYHELHAKQVDQRYALIALIVAAVWLAGLFLAFAGSRLGVFVAGALGFIEFYLVASSHFVTGLYGIGTFWKAEGLPVAGVLIGLLVACVLVVVSAVVCWSSPWGRMPRLDTVPVLVVALIGAVLIILQATDDIRRADFGTSNAEDGTFAAAVFASTWLLGGLWIARVRRVGAVLIALATFGIWFSFLTLHVLHGGIDVQAIAKRSGIAWAAFAAGGAILAGASFLFSLGVLLVSPFRRQRRASENRPTTLRRA